MINGVKVYFIAGSGHLERLDVVYSRDVGLEIHDHEKIQLLDRQAELKIGHQYSK